LERKMSDHITYGRAREIERVIKGSGVFIGTDEWLETEAITSEEFDAYFAYAAERASQLDWLDQHRDGQTEIVSTKASLEQISIKAAKTVMQFELSGSHAKDIPVLSTLTGQRLAVELYPEQMPLPLAMDEAEDVDEAQTSFDEEEQI